MTERGGGTDDGWAQLHADQIELRALMAEAADDDERSELLEALADNRAAIARLEDSNGDDIGLSFPADDSGLGSANPVDDGVVADAVADAVLAGGLDEALDDNALSESQDGVEGALDHGADGALADESGRSEVDELLAALVVDPEPEGESPRPGARQHDAPQHDAPQHDAAQHDAPHDLSGSIEEDRGRRVPVALLVALAAVAVVAIGAVAWIAGSASGGSETATTDRVETTAVEVPVDLDASAAEVLATLRRLGFETVDVEVRDSTIQLSGSVSSDADLSTVRSAALSVADSATIDLSQVEVLPGFAPGAFPPPPGVGAAPGAPPPPNGVPAGSPPPGYVPPTDDQRAAMRQDLEQTLSSTPLVFDSGSSVLNDELRQLLDTVIVELFVTHPGVPVRLVGYTDEAGSDYENSLLSIERSQAVQEYLVQLGVPKFLVRVEGRGEQDASGQAGVDRRIEIEVIEG